MSASSSEAGDWVERGGPAPRHQGGKPQAGPAGSAPWPEPKPVSDEQEAAVAELERLLLASPEPHTREAEQEDRRCRLLRFLRPCGFNAKAAHEKLHQHAKWWHEFGMENATEADELDENGPFFVCGEDRWGRPTIICRPCAHVPKDREESLLAARRCLITMQRCTERLRPGSVRQEVIAIYDCRGLSARNLDLLFAREVIPLFGREFPERLERVLIINNHWTMGFFWSAISLLLHPDVKAKISAFGTDFQSELLRFVPEDHPYMRYALQVQRDGDRVSMPPRSPYVLGCRAASEDLKPLQLGAGNGDDAWSRCSTAPSEGDNSQAGEDSMDSATPSGCRGGGWLVDWALRLRKRPEVHQAPRKRREVTCCWG